MKQRFEGQVAVVTGGASGIGRAVSDALAREGAHIVVADLNEQAAGAAAEAIASAGGKARAAQVDVCDAAGVEDLVARTFADDGGIDLMFNNAGIAIGGEMHEMPLAKWTEVMNVNVYGVIHGVAAAYPRMVERGRGHIVNTASLSGLLPVPGLTPYATTKHAVVGLSLSLRAEAAGHGVKVTAVCPSFVKTPILDKGEMIGVDAKRRDKMLEQVWPFDLMTPEDCAQDILRGIVRNDPLVVTPRAARLAWRAFRWLPRRVLGRMERVAARSRRG